MTELVPWRTYSIFISSTFADMQAERDHLKNFVLPKVKEELRKKRIRLEIVDLRWGLDTTSIKQEDEREVTVLKVCLDEIKRCKPFFICLLGDRYGWIPPEKRMDDATIGMDHISHHKGKSVTALEIEFGVLASKEQLVRSVFYLRNPLDYTKFSPERAAMFSDAHNPVLSEKEKKERSEALEKLKSSITSHFDKREVKNKVKNYTVNWEAQKEKVINLDTWGYMIYEDIIRDCIDHAQYSINSVPKNWQEKELALLDSFIENHTTTFCGREKLLEELKDHLLLKDPNNWGLVLTGESGSGKSAVFSMVNKIMRQEECFILSHSAGLSAKSRNILDLLQIWNKQLSDFLGIEYIEYKPQEKARTPDALRPEMEGEQADKPKAEIEKIQDKYRELLFTAAEKTQVVLLIDALDRFESTERAKFMTWLPTMMPGNIRMLCTAISGTEKKAAEYHSELQIKSIDFFTSDEAKKMLNMLCNLQHKSIPVKVESVILKKKREDGLAATSSPLWLSLAVNILMAMDNDDFEKMKQLEGRGDEQIADYMETLANDFPALPGKLFLSLLSKAASVFGVDFTWRTLNYIACSRDGLRESDLEKLIPKTEDENWDALLFANLRRWFNKHLREEGEDKQWNLVHSVLRNSLLEEMDEKKLNSMHNSIATHLLTLPAEDELRVSETMYHFMQAENAENALDYYISELANEEKTGATVALTEEIANGDKGLNWCYKLLETAKKEDNKLWLLAPRFVYELNDMLMIEGYLDTRREILEKLTASLIETDTDYKINTHYGYDFALLQEKLGEIYQALGKLDQAQEAFSKFNSLIKELHEDNPEDEDFKNALAISYEKLGIIYQTLGKIKQSLESFVDFNKLISELCEINPINLSYKTTLAISCGQLGEIYRVLGKFDRALEYNLKYNQLFKELYESELESEDIKNNFAISYEKLGAIYQTLGKFDKTLQYYKLRSGLSEELYESNPKNEELKNGLAISNEKLGEIYQVLGDFDQALEYYFRYKQLSKELFESNPKNEGFIDILATSYGKLGECYEGLGNLDQALEFYNNYNSLTKELYESNPKNERLKNILAVSYEKLGNISQALGKFDQSLQYYIIRRDLGNELYEHNPTNENYKSVAISLYKLGYAYTALNQVDKSINHFEEAAQIFKKLSIVSENEEYKDSYEHVNQVITEKMLDKIYYIWSNSWIEDDIEYHNPANDSEVEQSWELIRKIGKIEFNSDELEERLQIYKGVLEAY